ncbi:MAG: HNH endonuclease [Oscillospiraceae bacterium]|jgi:group II intron reverse transcriptase/maturase|nr:HNH endonuclease [Oscillospiraceae bacterium]
MSTNNIYYVDMEQRFNDFKNGNFEMDKIHETVYDIDNVSLALRRLSKSSGRMSKGHDGTNFQTLEKYSIYELSEIVKDRLLNRKMNYVRRMYIPKDRKKSKMRPLGICSVWDKLVEKCIQLVLDPYCETKFVDSSFGFREQVSAHNALARVKNQCQTMPFVLSLDLQDYFGTLDPDITYREMWHIGIKNQVILNYIYQFIKKGYYEDSCKVESPKGAPQGSILGPLIANLYLHRFDVWLKDQGDCWHDENLAKFHDERNRRRNLERTNLKIGIHVRYADDILVLCKDREDAEKFKFSITKYLTRNMKLLINEDKTKIYDLSKERMKFLGYVFYVWGFNQNKGKHRVSNKLPKEKADEIVEKCRELLNKIKKKPCFEAIHNWNTYVVGLHNYYKGMTHFYKCFTCIGWRVRKLFYHTMSRNAKFIKEQSYKNNFMEGTYRSWGINGYYTFKCYPVIEIWWANWDIKQICGKRSRVARENPYDYGDKKHKPGVSLEAIGYLVNTSKHIKSSRLAMFRVSKYSSVKGISYLSGEFVPVEDYHCHHIIPKHKNGTHDFENLCVLSEAEHIILHSPTPERLYELYPKRKAKIKMLIKNL